jgi:hypothetical protein
MDRAGGRRIEASVFAVLYARAGSRERGTLLASSAREEGRMTGNTLAYRDDRHTIGRPLRQGGLGS